MNNLPQDTLKNISNEHLRKFGNLSKQSDIFKALVRKEIHKVLETKGKVNDTDFENIIHDTDIKSKVIDYLADKQYRLDFYRKLESLSKEKGASSKHSDLLLKLKKFFLEKQLVDEEQYKNILDEFASNDSSTLYRDNFISSNKLDLYDLIMEGKIPSTYDYIYKKFLPIFIQKYGSKQQNLKLQALVKKGIISKEQYSDIFKNTIDEFRKYKHKSDYKYIEIIDFIKEYNIDPNICKEDIEYCFRTTNNLDVLCNILDFNIIDIEQHKLKLEKAFWLTFFPIVGDYNPSRHSLETINKFLDYNKKYAIFDTSGYTVLLDIFHDKIKRGEYKKEESSGGENKYSIKNSIRLDISPSYEKKSAYSYYKNIEYLQKLIPYFDESDKDFLDSFIQQRVETINKYELLNHSNINSDFIKEIFIILQYAPFIDKDKAKKHMLDLYDKFKTKEFYGDCGWEKSIFFIVKLYEIGFFHIGENKDLEEDIKNIYFTGNNENHVDELVKIGFFSPEEIEKLGNIYKKKYYDDLNSLNEDSGMVRMLGGFYGDEFNKIKERDWVRSFNKEESVVMDTKDSDTNEVIQKIKLYGDKYGIVLAKKCVLFDGLSEKLDMVLDHFAHDKKKVDLLRINFLEKDWEKLYLYITTNNTVKLWKYDVDRFCKPDERQKVNILIDVFGEDAIYAYLDSGTRDPHDAVQHHEKLIEFYQKEYGENDKKHFIHIILKETGSSNVGYNLLNSFLIQYKKNWRATIKKELESKNITNPKFINLANTILDLDQQKLLTRSRDNVFKIGDLLYILSQKPALKQLEKLLLSKNKNDKILYEYYSTGILSPRKKDVQTMMMMFSQPDRFLGLDDTNAPKAIHRDKKPQHMVTSFPHMDLEAEELVSSLPLGIYDKLTYFKPMTMTIVGDKWGNIINREGIFDIKNLVGEYFSLLDNKTIQKLVQDYNNTVGKTSSTQMSFQKLKSDFTTLSKPQKKWLLEQTKLKRYVAQISPKSDISNWYNGFNCDSLSVNHGKKVVMMFNPYCADFCLYKDIPSDKVDNLLATSRVTLNIPIEKNVVEIKELLESGKDPRTALSQQILGSDFSYVLTLDNIEADANFSEKVKSESSNKILLQNIYKRFFELYIKKYSISPNNIPISTKKMNCGMSHGKIDIFDTKENNTTLPVFLNSYSDNVQEQTLKIDLDAGDIHVPTIKTGIHPMNIEDIMKIIYLEGSIYPVGIKDHPANLQHEITASIINNNLKERANLDFVAYDDVGKAVGYIIAYQGKMDKSGKSCIYINDLAVDQNVKGNYGLKLIMQFMDVVQKIPKSLPIVAELRETTSYPIVKQLLSRYGYQITKDTLSKFQNGENKHEVIIEKIS